MSLSTLSTRRIICHTISPNFRKATKIITEPLSKSLLPLDPDHVLVQNHFLGINASDINFTNGKYMPGVSPPFPVGFESVGKVVAIGDDVKHLAVGDAVAMQDYGAFTEYQSVPQKQALKVPAVSSSILPLTVCGVTASIALEEVGQMKSGETVLVTAAAGATGQFAVQLAKLAGNTVIGTCSSAAKVKYLESIGCDRVVNYREEELRDVLSREFPEGLDLVFESVGGPMFKTCLDHIAIKGRIITIGAVSGYEDGSAWSSNTNGSDEKKKSSTTPVNIKLLRKSASIRGFFLQHYWKEAKAHAAKLTNLIMSGKLNAGVDPTRFVGLESVADALDYMYDRKNIGKLVVELNPSKIPSNI